MKTEEIIDRLRHPQKYRTPSSATVSPLEEVEIVTPKSHSTANLLAFFVAMGVLGLAAVILLVTLHTKKRAEDLSASLNPDQVQGLSSESTDFDPRKIVTYVNINELGEGGDRVPTVEELGATIPIISRYNYQALTQENYRIIGAAPWALSSNVEANLKDAELLRYLLNRPEVANAFVQRPDTAPLLADPQLLAAFVQDTAALQSFFSGPLAQQILASEALTSTFAQSRFISTLLTSKAVKFYRDHPQQFAQLIQSSPVLAPLTQNPYIRKAVQENFYLKNISSQLLGISTSNKKVAQNTRATAKSRSK